MRMIYLFLISCLIACSPANFLSNYSLGIGNTEISKQAWLDCLPTLKALGGSKDSINLQAIHPCFADQEIESVEFYVSGLGSDGGRLRAKINSPPFIMKEISWVLGLAVHSETRLKNGLIFRSKNRVLSAFEQVEIKTPVASLTQNITKLTSACLPRLVIQPKEKHLLTLNAFVDCFNSDEIKAIRFYQEPSPQKIKSIPSPYLYLSSLKFPEYQDIYGLSQQFIHPALNPPYNFEATLSSPVNYYKCKYFRPDVKPFFMVEIELNTGELIRSESVGFDYEKPEDCPVEKGIRSSEPAPDEREKSVRYPQSS